MANLIEFNQILPFLGRISNQSHKAHLNWSKTFRDRVQTEIIERLGVNCPELISSNFALYSAAVTEEDEVAIVIQKNQQTDDIKAADDVRDNTWVGIKSMADALLRIGTAEQKTAAKRFIDIANAHDINISQKYEIQTESLRQFIQQCEGDLASVVATLGLTSLIAQLKVENEAVHTLIYQRNTDAANLTLAAMSRARDEVDKLYKQLVFIINAFTISTWSQGVSPYDIAINLINQDIDYYDKHVFSKKSKSSNDQGSSQSGNNSSNSGSSQSGTGDGGNTGNNGGSEGGSEGGSGEGGDLGGGTGTITPGGDGGGSGSGSEGGGDNGGGGDDDPNGGSDMN